MFLLVQKYCNSDILKIYNAGITPNNQDISECIINTTLIFIYIQ